MSCSKYFHLPCVLASGGFQDFQTKSSFCKDHVYQVPLVCEYALYFYWDLKLIVNYNEEYQLIEIFSS